jgi:hypothetical protein
MDAIDPLKLDRDIARAARAERRWWRTLRSDVDRAAADAWYEPVRYVTTRTTYLEVAELPASDPLREPFLRWVHRLALTRIAGRAIVDAARARQNPSLELEIPESGTFSPGDLVRRALAEREAARARAWLDGFGEAGSAVLAAEKILRETTIEITARLGVDDPSSLAVVDRAAISTEAERVLARTGDLASSLLGPREDLAGLIADLVTRDVPGVWPRSPDARWLYEQFHGTALLEGLALDLGPTPPPLGASSFARGLARFGAAYARAAVLGGGPFVLLGDPSDTHPMRRGALFASLLLDLPFLRKKVGLSREAAAETARALAATVLARARIDAAMTLVDFALASPSQIEEAASEALCVRVPRALGGVLPRPDARAPSRLAGMLLALGDRDELTNRFDEDWFVNPRAFLFLRESDASPRSSRLPKEALGGTGDRLAQSLEALGD